MIRELVTGRFLKRFETARPSRRDRIAALGYDFLSQAKEALPSCNLCNSINWTILSHRDRYGFPATSTACNVCSLTMLNPRLTPSAYKEFYINTYRPLISAYTGLNVDADTIKETQRRYATELESLIHPFLQARQGTTFLDIGGSTGVVAAQLSKRYGLTPTVLDPAPAELSEAAAVGIETITGLIEEWQPNGRSFKIVGMFQTIDHLLDVAATLHKIRNLLEEDGLFVFDIVDFRAAYLRNWSVDQAIKIDHPFYLTEETTETFLARIGFNVLRKAYSADHHLVAYVCQASKPRVDALPTGESIKDFFSEIRWVQNVSR
jgi:SAM-dependent methyltransferase